MRIVRSIVRLRSEERGAALVEFALVVPFLMIMMCAIIDFGLMLHRINNLNSAVREGARFGAVRQKLTPAMDSVKTRVQSYWRTVGTDSLPKALITVAETTDASGLRSVLVRVTNYPYKPMTPLAPLLGMGTVNFTRTAIYRQEFQ